MTWHGICSGLQRRPRERTTEMTDERLNILLIAKASDSTDIVRQALVDSSTRCRLHRIEPGAMTLPYLRREGPYADAPKPDLIFFDLAEGDPNLITLLQRIKSRSALSRIPSVLLTRNGEPLPEDIDIGQDTYTNFSPVDLESFLGALNAISPARFMEAIALLETHGFVLVRLPEPKRAPAPNRSVAGGAMRTSYA